MAAQPEPNWYRVRGTCCRCGASEVFVLEIGEEPPIIGPSCRFCHTCIWDWSDPDSEEAQ